MIVWEVCVTVAKKIVTPVPKRPPIYVKYDSSSVYVERGDLKQYWSPLRCLIELYP